MNEADKVGAGAEVGLNLIWGKQIIWFVSSGFRSLQARRTWSYKTPKFTQTHM